MKTVCIDARLWGVRHTGIGRYVENLVAHLPGSPDVNLVLIVPPDLAGEARLAGIKKYFALHHPYSFLAQLEMLWLLIRIRPRLLHVPHFTIPVLWPGPMVVTIHDLIKHQSRGPSTTTRSPLLYWFKYLQYLAVTRLAVTRARRIIVPARYWQRVLSEKYRLSPEKITVTYEGVDRKLFGRSPASIDVPDQPYLLYVGNVYPHKNISVLLSAVGKLKGRVLLILVCARSVFADRIRNQIQEAGVGKWAKFMENLPDRDLVALYQHALAFVFPSLIEGFGLPGLEAMAAGTPVIAARASCLPEIYGKASLYFDPHDSDDLADKVARIASDSDLRTRLVNSGRRQAAKYSWEKMARQTWQIYLDLLRD